MHKQHPALATLIDLTIGDPCPDDVSAHVGRCAACQSDVRVFQRIIAALRSPAASTVPQPLIERASQLLAQRPAAAAPQRRAQASWGLRGRRAATWRQPRRSYGSPAPVRRLFDSAPMPIVAGAHSLADRSRRIVFCLDTCNLDLRVRARGAHAQIAGQLRGYLGPAPTVALQTASRTVEGELNAQLEFRFQEVPAGQYHLILHMAYLGDVTIELAV